MVRTAALAILLFVGACSDKPAATTADDADSDARQALADIDDLNESVANLEETVNQQQQEIEELQAATDEHDSRIKAASDKADQAQADVDDVKQRIHDPE